MFGFGRIAKLQEKLEGLIHQNHANTKINAELNEKIDCLEINNEMNFLKIAELKAEVSVVRKLYLKKANKRRRRVREC